MTPAKAVKNIPIGVQLFADTGKDFSERECIRLTAMEKNNVVEFDLSHFSGNIRRLRLDPSDQPWTRMLLHRLEWEKPDGTREPVSRFTSNAIFQWKRFLLFSTRDSQIRIPGSRASEGKLVAEIEFLSPTAGPGQNTFRNGMHSAKSFRWKKTVEAASSILVIDLNVPEYDKNCGSRATFQHLLLLRKMGLNVVFFPDRQIQIQPYVSLLEAEGIQVVFVDDWRAWMKKELWTFDYIQIHRPNVFSRYLPMMRPWMRPDAKILYFVHDLHHVRLERQYQLTGDLSLKRQSEEIKRSEFEIFAQADVIQVAGHHEQAYIQQHFPQALVRNTPLLMFPPDTQRPVFGKRFDFLYVGGFSHLPNVDAVLYLVREIFPEVLKRMPGIKLFIIGSDAPPEVLALQSAAVKVVGYVPDEQLDAFYRQCRLLVVPLRYGAGVKGKILEGMHHGIGVVASEIGAEGIVDAEKALYVCRNTEEFVSGLVKAYADEAMYLQKTSAAAEIIRRDYSQEAVIDLLKKDISPRPPAKTAASNGGATPVHPLEFPAGHFYSPIPDRVDLEERADQIWKLSGPNPVGIDMNEEGQEAACRMIEKFYPEIPFPNTQGGQFRFFFDNPHYPYSDAICLFGMMRWLKPKRILEIGSGHSSALMMDTNDLFLGGKTQMTFIEPYPELLHSRMRPADAHKYRVWDCPLQSVPLGVFSELEANDILFIDSTHVSKAGSDVNRIFFEILPALKPGVHVHFHDIFFPMEYPKPWIMGGRLWNELYLMRGFLMYNKAFRIKFWNNYFFNKNRQRISRSMPNALNNMGSSLWLEKTGS